MTTLAKFIDVEQPKAETFVAWHKEKGRVADLIDIRDSARLKSVINRANLALDKIRKELLVYEN